MIPDRLIWILSLGPKMFVLFSNLRSTCEPVDHRHSEEECQGVTVCVGARSVWRRLRASPSSPPSSSVCLRRRRVSILIFNHRLSSSLPSVSLCSQITVLYMKCSVSMTVLRDKCFTSLTIFFFFLQEKLGVLVSRESFLLKIQFFRCWCHRNVPFNYFSSVLSGFKDDAFIRALIYERFSVCNTTSYDGFSFISHNK